MKLPLQSEWMLYEMYGEPHPEDEYIKHSNDFDISSLIFIYSFSLIILTAIFYYIWKVFKNFKLEYWNYKKNSKLAFQKAFSDDSFFKQFILCLLYLLIACFVAWVNIFMSLEYFLL